MDWIDEFVIDELMDWWIGNFDEFMASWIGDLHGNDVRYVDELMGWWIGGLRGK